MARIKDVFDPDVVAALAGQPSEQVPLDLEEAKPKPKPVKKGKAPKGTQWFSKLFGFVPEMIPDLPIKVFADGDWPEQAQHMIPDPDPVWVWDRKVLEQIAVAMHCGDTLLLHGMPGTGKSCALKQWCAITRIPFWRINCNAETREQHFLGAPNLRYDDEGKMYIKQEPTVLTDSLRYGGLFCEDEAFRHTSALVLQSLREKANRTVVLPDAPGMTSAERVLKAPEGRWWYTMTDNTNGVGDSTGQFDAQVQDASTLDRIDVTVEVSYLPKDVEFEMLKKHAPKLEDELLKNLINVATEVRKAFSGGHMLTTMSVRGLMAWAEKIDLTDNIAFALKLVMFNKLSDDDRAQVRDIYNQVFGVPLT